MQDKSRAINLWVRSADAELWRWAEAVAAERRMSLSQYLASLIERAKKEAEGDDR